MSTPSAPHEPDAPEGFDAARAGLPATRSTGSFERLLGRTRVIILFGGLASLLASIALLVAALIAVVETIWDHIRHGEAGPDGVKHLAVDFIELTDAVLLGTVLYIIALGLYELFFDQDLPVPEWLRFRSLTELKASLIEVIIVLLGVVFLGRAVTWTGAEPILEFGIAIAAVIFALGAVLVIGHLRERGNGER